MSLAAATDNCCLCKREPATVTRLGLPFCQGCLDVDIALSTIRSLRVKLATATRLLRWLLAKWLADTGGPVDEGDRNTMNEIYCALLGRP